jgi:hypothetical protein
MRASDGILYLAQFAPEDRERAIEIARKCAPSGAFRLAQLTASARGQSIANALAFAKGTRWLAVIRRDEGVAAFLSAVEEVRRL